jgi:hypothetical protein
MQHMTVQVPLSSEQQARREQAELEYGADAQLSEAFDSSGLEPIVMSDILDNDEEGGASSSHRGDDEDEGEQGGVPYAIAGPAHFLLRQRVPRTRVAAVFGGGPAPYAATGLASARTLVDMLRTRPFPSQKAEIDAFLEKARA